VLIILLKFHVPLGLTEKWVKLFHCGCTVRYVITDIDWQSCFWWSRKQ